MPVSANLVDGGGHAIRVLRWLVVKNIAFKENRRKSAMFGLYERLSHCMKSAHENIPQSQMFHLFRSRVITRGANKRNARQSVVSREILMKYRVLSYRFVETVRYRECVFSLKSWGMREAPQTRMSGSSLPKRSNTAPARWVGLGTQYFGNLSIWKKKHC